MRATTIFCLMAIASALELAEVEEPNTGNYAYVTMWLNKATAPERVFKHVLTKEETVFLNSGQVNGETGLMNLMKGQAVKTSISFAETEEEGKPAKLKAEVQKTPLRPRNNMASGITDLAMNLRQVGSKHPLVVLTNSEDLQNKELLAQHPNIKLIWLNETDFLERGCKIGAGHELHFQKLMIWKLTQYDKLIWLDTDLAFTNSPDYVFNMDLKGGNQIYGQIDDYHCDGRDWSPTSGGICTGMLLVKPSTLHFQGLMQHQKKMQACWGDQSIISTYWNGQKGRRALQFKRDVINFARCKAQGKMDVWHFSGCPDCKRIGDPEGFKRTSTGMLVNQTELKLKAQAKAEKKQAEKQDAKKKKKMDLTNKKE